MGKVNAEYDKGTKHALQGDNNSAGAAAALCSSLVNGDERGTFVQSSLSGVFGDCHQCFMVISASFFFFWRGRKKRIMQMCEIAADYTMDATLRRRRGSSRRTRGRAARWMEGGCHPEPPRRMEGWKRVVKKRREAQGDVIRERPEVHLRRKERRLSLLTHRLYHVKKTKGLTDFYQPEGRKLYQSI